MTRPRPSVRAERPRGIRSSRYTSRVLPGRHRITLGVSVIVNTSANCGAMDASRREHLLVALRAPGLAASGKGKLRAIRRLPGIRGVTVSGAPGSDGQFTGQLTTDAAVFVVYCEVRNTVPSLSRFAC